MRGVQFDEYHTAEDWDLILNSKKIDPPTPKHITVSVDGRDGDLDLSDVLTGEVKYENREISFTFLLCEGSQVWREERITEIINYIHGKKLMITEPDDPDHYFIGRCSVSDIHNDKAYASFSVSANCEPYRYFNGEINRIINPTATPVDIVLTNTGRKTLTPTIIVSESVNLTINNVSVALSAGTYKLTELLLRTGNTIVTVKGSGTVTFNYREAVL